MADVAVAVVAAVASASAFVVEARDGDVGVLGLEHAATSGTATTSHRPTERLLISPPRGADVV
jgi:hypothetical protein